MKKTYISPEIQLTVINCETLIAQSTMGKYSGDGGSQLVKEDVSSSSRNDDYNVWDDDWSK